VITYILEASLGLSAVSIGCAIARVRQYRLRLAAEKASDAKSESQRTRYIRKPKDVTIPAECEICSKPIVQREWAGAFPEDTRDRFSYLKSKIAWQTRTTPPLYICEECGVVLDGQTVWDPLGPTPEELEEGKRLRARVEQIQSAAMNVRFDTYGQGALANAFDSAYGAAGKTAGPSRGNWKMS
jgi:hypothetical protein